VQANDSQFDPAKLIPMLAEMERLVQESNIDALSCLESIKSHIGAVLYQEEIRQLEEHINNFDFENALPCLRRIVEAVNILTKGG